LDSVTDQTVRSTPPLAGTAPAATLSFAEFTLAEPLLRGVTATGYTKPTDVQARALPVALEGRDIMCSAQTGTGKTAAFALPAMQRLLVPSKLPGRGPRVLVLTPTRELAMQVESVFHELGRFAKLKMGLVVGGVSYQPQERLLKGPVDVLVATPGRLIDHLDSKLVDFARIELLVLDEADRMLDMGFIEPVRRIVGAMSRNRQTLLFSATLEGGVLAFAKQFLREPVTIQLTTAKKRHESIAQRVLPVSGPEHKQALLAHLLSDPAVTQAIIFTSTKRGADKLAKRLNGLGHPAAALHGNMRQSARTKTVDLLRQGKVRLLVATDVAARGLDLEGISHIINYELPSVAEDYIHRVGRTGRNGATGTALSLIGPDDRTRLASIERLIGRRLEQQIIPVVVPPGAVSAGRSSAPGGSGRSGRPHVQGGGRSFPAPAGRAPLPVSEPRRSAGARARHSASSSSGGWR
jgi:superfamily II DNA/RNA helicase